MIRSADHRLDLRSRPQCDANLLTVVNHRRPVAAVQTNIRVGPDESSLCVTELRLPNNGRVLDRFEGVNIDVPRV